MDYLPLFFNLQDRPVLLIGGGDVGLRKARLLVRAGARVQLVSREVHPELQQLLAEHQGQVLGSEYQQDQLQGVALVIAATDDEALNRRVHEDCVAQNLPVNVVDNPPLCTFVFPAILDRSPLVIGISSGGKAPVLARLLRAKLESLIPTRYSDLGQLAGRFRDAVKQRFSDINQRRKFWENTFEGTVAERVFNGQMQEAETLLQQQLDQADGAAPAGEVYLVGAGPGDPELLTFKALRLMQQADVVLYDRLVSPAVLDLCRRDAEMIYVGKKRDNHSVPQPDINRLLVEKARAGHRVVRLKGGDPFVFGRGGEELEELKAAGVPFQVVPGITSANACSAYAGIPLTHRDYAQSVKLITGQLKNRTSDLNFAEMVQPNQTLVFYMGLHTLELLVEGLLQHGKPADTLIALVSQGSTPQQRVLTGTLADIVEKQAQAQLQAPALIIVGEVVALQQQLAWFNTTG
ncbi:siroheme synthase CysG [Marinospirillum alkaliphilum]|uniref:Siroheme synthase n=1 Tax=Marinospirillum alkaliphilum DSM 21637 TaxID=1122209 RepID=A0A1K1YWZ8_9GAMM|nr:siroheme synthase CysG [Marinospirillum alkaliphilum]SFX65876.1 uroporphyrin-III C-methyltransferase / precorrin-2 dehydrogenase / sirohydrochlorin ferrochelatase [Marinospirillum alkaliphilum DSM 21637]